MEENLEQQRKKKQAAMVNNAEDHFFMDENDEMNEEDTERLSKLFSIGIKFLPADEELIEYYLKQKVLNNPIPMNFIRCVNLHKCNPQQLTAMHPFVGEKVWYFFTRRNREQGNDPNRAAADGYWKATGARTIIYSIEGQKVGFKKAFTFYERNAQHGEVQTKWRMHEFRLDLKIAPIASSAPDDKKFDDWVLCKIYYKEAAKVKNNLMQDNAEPQSNQYPLLNILVEMLNFLGLTKLAPGDDSADTSPWDSTLGHREACPLRVNPSFGTALFLSPLSEQLDDLPDHFVFKLKDSREFDRLLGLI